MKDVVGALILLTLVVTACTSIVAAIQSTREKNDWKRRYFELEKETRWRGRAD